MLSDSLKTVRNFMVSTALTLVLLIVSGYVPVLSLVFFVCSGVPLAFLAAKYDFRLVVPSVLIVGFAYWPFAGHWVNVGTTLIITILPAVVAGYMLGRKQPFFSILLSVCILVCFGWIVQFTTMKAFFGISVDDIIATVVGVTEELLHTLMMKLGEAGIPVEQINPTETVVVITSTLSVTLKMFFPSIIVCISIMMGYAVLRLSGFCIRITKAAEIFVVPFSGLRAPRSMCFVGVIVFLLYMFSDPMSGFGVVIANVMFILYGIICICGFSCVDFWFSRAVKNSFLRVLVYIGGFLVVNVLISLIIDVCIIIGILDSSRDFRRMGIYKE